MTTWLLTSLVWWSKEEPFLWRVPVTLAVLPHGRLGQVGTIDVDAQSGQLQMTSLLIEDIRRNARSLVASPTALEMGYRCAVLSNA